MCVYFQNSVDNLRATQEEYDSLLDQFRALKAKRRARKAAKAAPKAQ